MAFTGRLGWTTLIRVAEGTRQKSIPRIDGACVTDAKEKKRMNNMTGSE